MASEHEEQRRAKRPRVEAALVSERPLLSSLKLSSLTPLEAADSQPRSTCPGCQRSRKFFCYDCVLATAVVDDVPRLRLPIKIDIVMHSGERRGKATGVHAGVLAPQDVRVFTHPNQPEYQTEDTVLLYPSATATPMSDVDLAKVKRVVFIDSTWQQSRSILADPALSKLPRVVIQSHKTTFWRFQNKVTDEGLATIEAIYYLAREVQTRINAGSYDGEVDDLLWYYAFFYRKIQQSYHQRDRAFIRIDGWLENQAPVARQVVDPDASAATSVSVSASASASVSTCVSTSVSASRDADTSAVVAAAGSTTATTGDSSASPPGNPGASSSS